jgi:hypothetical protein
MTDIEKTEAEIKVLQKKLELLKEMEKHKTPCEKAFKKVFNHYPNEKDFREGIWFGFEKGYNASKEDCKVEEPKPMDEVVDKLIKEQQAQKLYNRLYDELGFEFDTCNDIVDIVEDWILEEQNASGSQNVNTELLVEGFNDCVRKMKEMLR